MVVQNSLINKIFYDYFSIHKTEFDKFGE